MSSFFEWVSNNYNQCAILVAAVSTLIAAISTVVAGNSNYQNRKQYINSVQPELSMSLVEYDYMLYLCIKNTGKTAAKNIKIEVMKIENNGDESELHLDDLFNDEFELYPEESAQGQVAIFGRNICQNVFPKLYITVSFSKQENKKRVLYNRSVTYLGLYNEKITADVNLDTKAIESSLNSIAKSSVRTSNYLDGCQVCSFDELNILARKTLKNDLLSALDKDIEPVKSREETIDECFNRKSTR